MKLTIVRLEAEKADLAEFAKAGASIAWLAPLATWLSRQGPKKKKGKDGVH